MEFNAPLLFDLLLRAFGLWWVIIPGMMIGLVVGILPGFSAQNTLIILLPVTLHMPVDAGMAFMIGLYCTTQLGGGIPAILFNPIEDPEVTPDSVRRLVETRKVAVLGEINSQYVGIAPADDRLEPFWQLAEDLDVPVGIHMGAGPPGVGAFGGGYRARLSSALTLEDVLVRHPRLRLYVMHAGYPLLDDLLALLFVYPQVHVDISAIVRATPRPAFYRYLRGIVEAGFGNRVMFGSDSMVWPGTIEPAIVEGRRERFG